MIKILYHDGLSGAAELSGQTDAFENASGNGEIHCYRLFDGVNVMRMRLEMERYTEVRTRTDVLEINFCAGGRFETQFSMQDHVLMKPGDMAVTCYDGYHGKSSESWFPLGYYEGICLEVEPVDAGRWLERNAPAFPVNFKVLKENLLGNKWYLSSPAGPRCEHVFRELYESMDYVKPCFSRLKVLELLMLLSDIPRMDREKMYCSVRQVELIRHLRDHLVMEREHYVSLAQLAAEHDISVSHMQKLFKQIYGVPVYRYIKEYRLEQAAVELVQTRKLVTQIAQENGYDNASKFSESFKKRYGMTPSQYRINAKNMEKRSK